MACSKRTFGSAKAAKKSVEHMHETIRTYYCKECGGYHTTQERYSSKVNKNARAWRDRSQKRQASARRKGRM